MTSSKIVKILSHPCGTRRRRDRQCTKRRTSKDHMRRYTVILSDDQGYGDYHVTAHDRNDAERKAITERCKNDTEEQHEDSQSCHANMPEAIFIFNGWSKHAKKRQDSEIYIKRYTVILSDDQGYGDYHVTAHNRNDAERKAITERCANNTEEQCEDSQSCRANMPEAIFIFKGWSKHAKK